MGSGHCLGVSCSLQGDISMMLEIIHVSMLFAILGGTWLLLH
jgi:hypothetical protein